MLLSWQACKFLRYLPVECSAGKPRVPHSSGCYFDSYHPLKHCRRWRTLLQGLLERIQGVDSASKFPRSPSDWAAVGCAGKSRHSSFKDLKDLVESLVFLANWWEVISRSLLLFMCFYILFFCAFRELRSLQLCFIHLSDTLTLRCFTCDRFLISLFLHLKNDEEEKHKRFLMWGKVFLEIKFLLLTDIPPCSC